MPVGTLGNPGTSGSCGIPGLGPRPGLILFRGFGVGVSRPSGVVLGPGVGIVSTGEWLEFRVGHVGPADGSRSSDIDSDLNKHKIR